MNRPPGEGFPYDQEHPVPAEYGVQAPVPRVQCGFPLDGDRFCRNSAPCPIHRDRRVGETVAEWRTAAGDDTERAETEALLNQAASRRAAPGLHETISGEPLPSFGELRERYGDPADLKPIPVVDVCSCRGSQNWPSEARLVAGPQHYVQCRLYNSERAVDVMDLHDQLHGDDQDWSVKTRLAKSLGRRALATRLVDALPPLLAAELADRLDTLVTQAVTETEAAITQEISDRYFEARARLDADAERKLREVHDERYKRPSRLD